MAIAYKFAARAEVTQIEDILVQVGRTGKVILAAALEAGVHRRHHGLTATLHNQDEGGAAGGADWRLGDGGARR